MENRLSNYLNRELKDSIGSMRVIQGTSKEGKPYYAIEIRFINQYSKRLFLKSDEEFAWTNAFDQLETQVQVNANFN